MIIPVTNENERIWAELCVALWPEDSIEEWIQEGRDSNYANQYLYMTGGEAVAFVSLSLRHDYVEGADSGPVGYLEGIYVKPEYQNKGIARELVEFAKAWSAGNGCTQLASDCELSNHISRRFHNKVGFKEANTVVCFIMDLCST